jgi:hypothetical protein
MRKQDWYRLVCWRDDRVTGCSEPMPRDCALELFRECVARGGYSPGDPSRLTVVSVADRPDVFHRFAA